MRILVYVDGFNYYYGVFGSHKHGNPRPNREKWVNPGMLAQRISEQIWPNEQDVEIVRLRYCTSQPIYDPRDLGQIQRYQQLMNAIGSLPYASVIQGSFVERTKNARLYAPSHLVSRRESEFFDGPGFGASIRSVAPDDVTAFNRIGNTYEPNQKGKLKSGHPSTQSTTISVSMREEKGSDVNLAAYLVRDCLREEFDAALVLSNDSDLADAIRIARTESGKDVWVVSPHFRNRAVVSGNPHSRQRTLVDAASGTVVLDVNLLATCQFSDQITDATGKTIARRPREWN